MWYFFLLWHNLAALGNYIEDIKYLFNPIYEYRKKTYVVEYVEFECVRFFNIFIWMISMDIGSEILKINVWEAVKILRGSHTPHKLLADVDISENLNAFTFWTKYKYILKKTGIWIHFFFKIEGIPWITDRVPGTGVEYISFFCHRIRIQLPAGIYGPQPNIHMMLLLVFY